MTQKGLWSGPFAGKIDTKKIRPKVPPSNGHPYEIYHRDVRFLCLSSHDNRLKNSPSDRLHLKAHCLTPVGLL